MYEDLCKATFAKWYANYKKSFYTETYKADMTLSTKYWSFMEDQVNIELAEISWTKFELY